MSQLPEPESMDAFFNARADGYDAHMAHSLSDADTYYRMLAQPLPRTQSPLEILVLGCGTGLEIPALLDRAPSARLTCIDLSAEMLRILKKKFPEESLSIIQGSYLTHDFGAARFDAVLSSMTLHHLLPDRKAGLYAKLFKTLKPGGLYVEGDYLVSTEKMDRLMAEYRSLSDEVLGGTHHIDIPLSLAVQTELLERAGFDQIQTIYAREESIILKARKP